MPALTSADTIRILVATDSHVGYEERDLIRKDDSWRSFDEVMQLAKSQDVDMVLLAGDLFHDNKPSRKSMYQVMRSLRQNCLGEKPCELEWLSDASDIFDGAFNHVNYEDPDINVAIPVFSIHGNHDDPTGDGHFCTLDLLQVSGLLNYFGRTPESDKIEIKPVLLQKGQTKLALYGMSNVRDERLFRTFSSHNVKFYRPGVQQKDWFNLMAVHQNHHAHSETGYLPENFLPEFLDLVVWGHEHECLIDPRLNPEMMFHVMQPGSSVATSLVPGEAVPKHVAVVEITGKEFKIVKHRIKSVRPFVTREITLSADARFRTLAKLTDNRTQITKILEGVVEEMIEEARSEWLSIQDEDDPEPDKIPLPLVRLRVETSAPNGGKFEVENPQRFSNRFVGKVANVNDVVQFHRKKTGVTRRDKNEEDKPDEAVIAAMTAESIKVEKLVKEFLTAQSLKILPQAPFGDAVSQFVDKQDRHAMETFVAESLEGQVKGLLLRDIDDDEEMVTTMDRFREEQDKAFAAGLLKRPVDGEWEDHPGAYLFEDAEEPAEKPAKRGRAPFMASDDDSVVATESVAKKAPTKKVPAKKAPAKPRAPPKSKAPAKAPAKTTTRGQKKAVNPSDDDEDVVMLDQAPAPKSQPKRAAATRGRQTQLNFTQTSQVSRPRSSAAIELSDDEISDEDDAFEPAPSSSTRRR
ncbi:Mre11 DNA-binding presumed domain-containing protein [Tricladium varicosporioides]|nr:Mre11 DNA-binding presumed domain-containing protein [Hymenoscyphus varicosporioides]